MRRLCPVVPCRRRPLSSFVLVLRRPPGEAAPEVTPEVATDEPIARLLSVLAGEMTWQQQQQQALGCWRTSSASVATTAEEGVEEEDMAASGVSGGIARDRSTTAQRSCQGSKTAAGRKRSPRERADLDGENGVVAWVDQASPALRVTRPSYGKGALLALRRAMSTQSHRGRRRALHSPPLAACQMR